MRKPTPIPVAPAFGYQRRWVDDHSQLKIIVKSRQVGITWIETLDIVLYLLSTPHGKWYYMSISEDRAQEAVEYAIAHCIVLGALVDVAADELQIDECAFKRLTITFPNGSKLIGLPSNPRTARGISGNVTFDEFFHHLDADQIWMAASPGTMWGYRTHVISTPNGRQGRGYALWTAQGKHDPEDIEQALRAGSQPIGDSWSRHFVDIHMAKADGHPVDVALQRELAGDEMSWEQEYLGKFLDEDLVWLPYSLIDAAYDTAATMEIIDSQRPVGKLFAGMDIGRKRDLTVLYVSERLATGRLLQKACIELKQSDFDTQEKVVDSVMPWVRKGCFDQTGIGEQLTERAITRWGSRVEGVSMSGNTPASLAGKIKLYYQRNKVGISDDPNLRRSLHAVRRQHTPTGQSIRYDAPRTKHGHADHFWAQALCIEASERVPAGLSAPEGIGARRYGESVGGRDYPD